MNRKASSIGLVSWAFYDWASSPFAAIIQTFVFPAYFVRWIAANETEGSAQWGFTIGLAGVVVAICGPILGAIADQSGRRKLWVVVSTMLCMISTALLWFVYPSQNSVLPALILVGLGTVGAESAFIFYNAMLPGLAGPTRIGRWSGWGWGLGYVGGMLCLVLAWIAFINGDRSWLNLDQVTAQNLRATFVLVAAWYFLFSLPLFFLTPERRHEKPEKFSLIIKNGVGQLVQSIREIRRYAHIARFLLARMLYTDGLATLFAYGGVYAAITFNMTARDVLFFGIALHVAAGLGALSFAWVDDLIGGKKLILLSLLGLTIPGILILLITTQLSFWIFGLMLGIFVGPLQAASRSYLARIAPQQLRNQLFGFYAFSGKATAFLGPFLVGWLTYVTASQRIGMATIVLFFLAGFLLMLTVPKEQV